MAIKTQTDEAALDRILSELLETAEATIEPPSGHTVIFRRAFERASEIGATEIAENMRREVLLFSLTVHHMAEPRFAPQLEFRWPDGTLGSFPNLDEHFPKEVLDYYEQRANTTTNPALRAQYADFLWTRVKDPTMARAAVDAYLELCPFYHTSDEIAAALRLADALWRALGLSLSVNDPARRDRSIQAHMFYLRELAAQEAYRGCIDIGRSLVEVLPRLKRALPSGLDLIEVARVLDETANYYHGTRNYLLERNTLDVFEHLWRSVGDTTRERGVKGRLTASHLVEGQAAEEAGGRSTVAAICYERVIPIWQELGIPGEQIESLKRYIRHLYEHAVAAEYGIFHTETPIPDEVVAAIVEPYEGLSPRACVSLLSIDQRIVPSYQKAERAVHENAEQTASSRLLPKAVMHGGLRAAQIQGENESLKFDTIQFFRLSYRIYNLAFLTPIFDRLLRNRRSAETAILAYLRKTGVVTEDRVAILASAIKAFLRSDYVSALHILLPQIEGVLRDMLAGMGRSTYKIKNRMMSEILLDEIITALGGSGIDEDLLRLLQYFLADRRADNLRNEIAHGLFPEAGFNRENAQLALFLLIRLASYELKRPDESAKPSTDELETRARERGERERQAIVEVGGKHLTSAEVADLLRVDSDEVEKLRAAGQLIGLPQEGRFIYPAWQLQGEGVLPGLADVLHALPTRNPWTQAAFLLGTSASLGGLTPLHELEQGHVPAVVRAARAAGEHGAD